MLADMDYGYKSRSNIMEVNSMQNLDSRFGLTGQLSFYFVLLYIKKDSRIK